MRSRTRSPPRPPPHLRTSPRGAQPPPSPAAAPLPGSPWQPGSRRPLRAAPLPAAPGAARPRRPAWPRPGPASGGAEEGPGAAARGGVRALRDARCGFAGQALGGVCGALSTPCRVPGHHRTEPGPLLLTPAPHIDQHPSDEDISIC